MNAFQLVCVVWEKDEFRTREQMEEEKSSDEKSNEKKAGMQQHKKSF